MTKQEITIIDTQVLKKEVNSIFGKDIIIYYKVLIIFNPILENIEKIKYNVDEREYNKFWGLSNN